MKQNDKEGNTFTKHKAAPGKIKHNSKQRHNSKLQNTMTNNETQ